MKEAILSVLLAVLVCGGTAFAQNSVEKTKRLTTGEVPVAVLKSFQKDHSDLEDSGFWKLHYTEKTVDGKAVFTPEHYSFNARKDHEKVVLIYTVDGTLESTKGTGAKN